MTDNVATVMIIPSSLPQVGSIWRPIHPTRGCPRLTVIGVGLPPLLTVDAFVQGCRSGVIGAMRIRVHGDFQKALAIPPPGRGCLDTGLTAAAGVNVDRVGAGNADRAKAKLIAKPPHLVIST